MAKCDKCGEEEQFECSSCEMDQHVKGIIKAAESDDRLVSTLAKKYISDMLKPLLFPFSSDRK